MPLVSKISFAPNATPSSRPSRSGNCGDTSDHARTSPSQAAIRARQPSIPSGRRSIEPTLYSGIRSVEVEGQDETNKDCADHERCSSVENERHVQSQHGSRVTGT